MKNLKLFPMAIVAFFIYAFLPNTFAQIQVESDGTVKVGSTASGTGQLNVNTTVSPTALYIYNNKNTSSNKYGLRNNVYSAGSGTKYGIYNYVQQNSTVASTKHTYGLYNYTLGNGISQSYGIYNKTQHSGSGNRYGIFNEITNAGDGRSYGIHNIVSSTTTGRGIYSYYDGGAGGSNYGIYNVMVNSHNGTGKGLYSYTHSSVGEAGYFSGNVYVSGVVTQSSDIATKENIKGMNNALALIGQLAPKSYNYKNIASLNLPEGEQYGFIAQDLERVLPTLVKDVEVVNPEELKGEGEQLKEIKSVNYIGLTPILVKAVQEQQDLIQQQQKLIEQLNQRLERLEQK